MVLAAKMRLRGRKRAPDDVVERVHGSLENLNAAWIQVYPHLAGKFGWWPGSRPFLDANLGLRSELDL